jgi:hypothetical protein
VSEASELARGELKPAICWIFGRVAGIIPDGGFRLSQVVASRDVLRQLSGKDSNFTGLSARSSLTLLFNSIFAGNQKAS